MQSRVQKSTGEALQAHVDALTKYKEEPKAALGSKTAPEVTEASGASLEVLLHAEHTHAHNELKVLEHCVALGACARVFLVFGRCCVL